MSIANDIENVPAVPAVPAVPTSLDDLTRAERTLLMCIWEQTIDTTRELRIMSRYPNPTDEQWLEMAARQHRAIELTIIGLRAPGEPARLAEINEVIRGLAEGALLAVLGAPPDAAAEQARN